MSSGADRRVVGAYASLQTLLPLVVFVIAQIVPNLVYSRRKGMSEGHS